MAAMPWNGLSSPVAGRQARRRASRIGHRQHVVALVLQQEPAGMRRILGRFDALGVVGQRQRGEIADVAGRIAIIVLAIRHLGAAQRQVIDVETRQRPQLAEIDRVLR